MNQSDDRVKLLFALSRGMIAISVLVAIIVSSLVLANYFQIQQADVLNAPSLTQLMRELKENTGNELLRQDVRSIHLLARKAYFNSLWQVRTGGYIILASLAVFVLSLKIFNSTKRRLPDPTKYRGLPEFLIFSRSVQNTIVAAGLVLFGSGITVALSTTTLIPDPADHASLQNLDQAIDLTQEWPNFRGPEGNAIIKAGAFPVEWDGNSGKNILWKIAVPGDGYSSPIVIGKQVFLTGGDATTRKVYCFSTENGELLWEQTVPNMLPPDSEFDFDFIDPGTGFAAPTMATNGERVVAIFATGDLACYTMSGDRAWGRNLGLLDNHYAHSSSLIIHKNLCLVQYDSFENPKLFAIDLDNGAIVWEKERQTISWSSPICVNTGERTELILADSKFLTSYNPVSGEQLWMIECLSGEVGPSPAYADGMVFTANEYDKATGIKMNDPGTQPAIEIVWENRDNLPNTASPVALEAYLLLATSGGMVSVLNTRTGEPFWEEYLGVGFYASPILVGETIYLMDLNGKMHIFTLGDNYESLATNELGEMSSCTPAFVRGRIYIRGEKHLYCIAEASS